jgi:hypothetical protein
MEWNGKSHLCFFIKMNDQLAGLYAVGGNGGGAGAASRFQGSQYPGKTLVLRPVDMTPSPPSPPPPPTSRPRLDPDLFECLFWGFTLVVLCLLYLLGCVAEHRQVRNRRKVFAAQVGLAIDNPLVDRAFEELTDVGRYQVQSQADLIRLLKERDRFLVKQARKAARKDQERWDKELFRY